MQVPFTRSHFKHPLATHSALDVLGYRRNGAPIYAIAGGSGEGAGGSGSAGQQGAGESGASGQASGQQPGQSGEQGSGQGGQQSGQAGQQGGQGEGEGTDWKAHAREWEKRAKANAGAVDELEKLRAANMSEQEKAVTEAEKSGRTAAAKEYGIKLAQAKFETATARAGVDLGEAAEYIDVSKFVGDDGEVNEAAIKSAVTKFSKLSPKSAGRSGGDFGGGSGDQADSLDKQIEAAEKARDFVTVIRLKRQRAAQTT